MKKLDLSNIEEGVRKLGAVKEFFSHIEEAYEETFAQLTKALVADSGSFILLRGCVNSGAGLDYDISAGAILKDGEVFDVAAFVGTAGVGQVPVLSLVTSNTQLQYTDNTAQNTLVTRTYAWTIGASGSGLVNFAGLLSFQAAVRVMLDLRGEILPNVQGASYTLVADDAAKNVIMNVGGANDVTVPPNSAVPFPIGTAILITQYGVGQTSIVAGAGVTIRSDGGILSVSNQYAGAALVKKATNEWLLYGSLGV